MASDNNRNAQDPNSIDQLNSNLTAASEKIANNKKIIFWAVGIIAVAACFTLSYLFIYRNPRIEKSFTALDQVEIQALGNDSIAAAEYKKVADTYGSTDAGNIAALSAAEALYNQGNYDEAIKYIKKFSTSDDVLESNALTLMGDCYVNLKKYDEAIDTFKKAVKACNENPQVAPRVLLKMANVYDEQKKYDQALECYQTIKADYPEFKLGNNMDIQSYIEREKARLGK